MTGKRQNHLFLRIVLRQKNASILLIYCWLTLISNGLPILATCRLFSRQHKPCAASHYHNITKLSKKQKLMRTSTATKIATFIFYPLPFSSLLGSTGKLTRTTNLSLESKVDWHDNWRGRVSDTYKRRLRKLHLA